MFPIAEKIRKSKKLVGSLWVIAGLLFLVSAMMEDGNKTNTGIGIMFLVLGIVSMRETDSKNEVEEEKTE